MFTLMTLALATTCAFARPQAPHSPGPAEIETRTYALPLPDQHHPSAAFDVLPFGRGDRDNFEGFENLVDAGQLLDLIRSIVSPERWEEPGYSLFLTSDRRLVASATPEMHADVARVLNFFDAHFGRTQDIAVEVFPVSAGVAIPVEVGGVMPAAASQRFVEELRAGKALGSPRAWTVRATPLSYATGGGRSEHKLVVDFDVEIAQAAAVPDPHVDSLDIGSLTTILASTVPGGVYLHALVSHSELLGPIVPKKAGVYRELIHTETGAFDRTVLNFELHHPRVSFGSSAATTYVPNGSELLQVYRAKSPWGEGGRLFRLRPLSRPEAPRTLALGQRVLALRDVGAAMEPNLEFGVSPRMLNPDSMYNDESASVAGFGRPSMDEMVEAIRRRMPDTAWEEGLEVHALGGMIVVSGTAERVAAVDALLEKEIAARATTENLVFLLQDRTGQETLAQVAFATCPGCTSIFSVGAQTLAIVDYGVEVAQGSSISDPVVSSVAHGVVGRVSTTRIGELLHVDLRAVVQILAGDFEITSTSALLDTPLERFEGARASLNENLRLASGESVRIGDLDPEGKTGLMLTVMRR